MGQNPTIPEVLCCAQIAMLRRATAVSIVRALSLGTASAVSAAHSSCTALTRHTTTSRNACGPCVAGMRAACFDDAASLRARDS